MAVTEVHEEKNTFQVDVNLPGADPRVSTPLFIRTRKLLIEREGGRCWLSGQTAEESGHPLEAHHHPVERSFANMWDFGRFSEDCIKGHWGPHAQAFDWAGFLKDATPVSITLADGSVKSHLKVKDPYLFVDDMTVNGLLLSKPFHTGGDEGIHLLPFPVYLAQKYGFEGYQFSSIEIIHHASEQPA
jgi:hypothetical protein